MQIGLQGYLLYHVVLSELASKHVFGDVYHEKNLAVQCELWGCSWSNV